MKIDRKAADILERHGFTLVRWNGKHYIYRHSAGAQVVVAKTPSDHRAYRNIEKHCRQALRRLQLGVVCHS